MDRGRVVGFRCRRDRRGVMAGEAAAADMEGVEEVEDLVGGEAEGGEGGDVFGQFHRKVGISNGMERDPSRCAISSAAPVIAR